jgi:hypothetical protein
MLIGEPVNCAVTTICEGLSTAMLNFAGTLTATLKFCGHAAPGGRGCGLGGKGPFCAWATPVAKNIIAKNQWAIFIL